MLSSSTLIRKGDGKRFRVERLAHWSDIVSEDGERDSVKWVGDDYYVSDYRGHGYLLEPPPPEKISITFFYEPDGGYFHCPVQSEVEAVALETMESYDRIYTEPVYLRDHLQLQWSERLRTWILGYEP